jgi:hypothetical protein
MPRLVPNRPDVLDEVFDGEAVLVNLGTGRYFALSSAGTAVWAALGKGAEWPDVLAAVPGDERVLLDFAHQLADEQLVTVEGDLPDRPDPADLPEGWEDGAPRMDVFTDMQDLLLLDPIHDVNLDGSGWPESA